MCDFEIDNYGDLDEYRENVLRVMDDVLGKNKVRKKVLCVK